MTGDGGASVGSMPVRGGAWPEAPASDVLMGAPPTAGGPRAGGDEADNRSLSPDGRQSELGADAELSPAGRGDTSLRFFRVADPDSSVVLDSGSHLIRAGLSTDIFPTQVYKVPFASSFPKQSHRISS